MATKRRRAIKYRNIAKIRDKQFNKLYRETMKQVKLVNERLNSLERRHESGTWASNKLKTRIKSNKTKGLMYKGKRIKLKPRMTKTNLTAVQKATRQFLESATSTNKGIKKIRRETVDTLKDTLNFGKKTEEQLSDKEVEKMYEMLGDKKTRNIVDELGGSLLFQEIHYAITHKLSAESFIERLNSYMSQDMDLDLRESALHIYNSYVL